MFRKDETARSEWSKANVENCVQRQRDILRTIWPTLRKGGYIIYSTCTFNRREDEENVLFIANELGAEIINLETDADWHICGDTTGRNLPVYHFFPHKTRGEGFFLALLKKTSDTPPAENRKSKRKSLKRLVLTVLRNGLTVKRISISINQKTESPLCAKRLPMTTPPFPRS